jgi:hypothetical protein
LEVNITGGLFYRIYEMITKRIILILGAGASKPYGFPVGRELVNIICDNLVDQNSKLFSQLRDSVGCKRSEILQFRDELFYSRRGSVDAFLEHRREWIDIGKHAIAQSLLEFEKDGYLFKKDDNWYEFLFDKLNTSFDDFDHNEISIITFNYDRSLEYFLFTALKNSYGKSDEECSNKMRNIQIIHVHGQLGYLPWQKQYGVPYSIKPQITSTDICKAAAEIRIIHENIDIDDDERFTSAHSLLKEKADIYFLGFGFNETNIKRLCIPGGVNLRGTGYGLEDAQRRSLNIIFGSGNNLTLANKEVDVLHYIKSDILFR